MVYIAAPHAWKLWFGWRFFVEPSGGHAPPWTIWTRLTEGPLVGHACGSLLLWIGGRAIWQLDGWSAWWWIVAGQLLWQAFNVERRAYSPETAVGQVVWRVLIGAVAGLLVVWWT